MFHSHKNAGREREGNFIKTTRVILRQKLTFCETIFPQKKRKYSYTSNIDISELKNAINFNRKLFSTQEKKGNVYFWLNSNATRGFTEI